MAFLLIIQPSPRDDVSGERQWLRFMGAQRQRIVQQEYDFSWFWRAVIHISNLTSLALQKVVHLPARHFLRVGNPICIPKWIIRSLQFKIKQQDLLPPSNQNTHAALYLISADQASHPLNLSHHSLICTFWLIALTFSMPHSGWD